MIDSKKKLQFYILADRISNIGITKSDNANIKNGCLSRLSGCGGGDILLKFKILLGLNNILKYLFYLRNLEYCINTTNQSYFRRIKLFWYRYKIHKLGQKLGFTIYPNTCGYGLRIPHWGTIVVGPNNKIGNYALLHTSTCIPGGNRIIGNFLKMSTGAKIIKDNIVCGDGTTVASNSVVNASCESSNCLLAGMPASIKRRIQPWILRDGTEPIERFKIIEGIKCKMGLGNPLEINGDIQEE